MSKRKLVGPITGIKPVADAVTLPAETTTLSDTKRTMPNLIARGGVFFPTKKALRLSTPKDVTMYHTGYEVTLDNRLLTAHHIPLAATIVQLMDENKSSGFKASIYKWLQDTYGRTGGPEYKRFMREIKDFANATMQVSNRHMEGGGTKFEVGGNFLNYLFIYDEAGKIKEVSINGNSAFFRYIFGDSLTKVDITVLNSLRGAVAMVLYIFYSSHRAFYQQPRKFSIHRDKLEHAIGMDLVAEKEGHTRKYVTRLMARGHEELVRVGVLDRVKGWKLENNIYTVHSMPPDITKQLPKPPATDKQQHIDEVAQLIKQRWEWPLGAADKVEVRTQIAARHAIDFWELHKDKWPPFDYYLPDLINEAMACAERKGAPKNIGWMANKNLWANELLEYLQDLNMQGFEEPATLPIGFNAKVGTDIEPTGLKPFPEEGTAEYEELTKLSPEGFEKECKKRGY